MFLQKITLHAQVDSSGKIVKLDLPAVILGNFSLAYEMQYAPHKSWELGLVVFLPPAGMLIDATKLSGFMLRAGQKSYPQTRYMRKRGLENRAMEGFYIRRDLFFLKRNSEYSVQFDEYIGGRTVETRNVQLRFHEIGFGAIYNLGYQKNLGRKVKFDAFMGMGLGYTYEQNNLEPGYNYYFNYENPNNKNVYGAILSFNTFTFAFQAGLKLGYVL